MNRRKFMAAAGALALGDAAALKALGGLALSMVALPFLSSSHIDREKRGAIVLGRSPVFSIE